MTFVTRPLVAFTGLALIHSVMQPSHDHAPSRAAALADAMREEGYVVSPEEVTWLDSPSGVFDSLSANARALVRAKHKDEMVDLYVAHVRLSPEGAFLSLGDVYDVTNSRGVDEDAPVMGAHYFAFATSLDGQPNAVHVMKLEGAKGLPADFSRLQRAQLAITNLQNLGQPNPVSHDVYSLEQTAQKVTLAWKSDSMLDVDIDGKKIAIDVSKSEVIGDPSLLRAAPQQGIARPAALVPWTVDRVRAVPWFGEEKMQWVKAIAFKALEYATDAKASMSNDTGAEDAARDIDALKQVGGKATFTDPEIGWPPPPMKPTITPALPGEGEWIALDKDPFITQTPGAPPAFLTSFIRTDAKRPATRIYVTLWDPRQIALHMEAGTVEPIGASGEAGPGMIPRTPEIIKRVVGGFNGGFQALHGEFGMQANGIEYLPPKPYAATIIELRDGSTAFGAWPRSPQVPEEILSYRQNLTALVENDKFNPWGRTWWGGTPVGWYDNIHTTRSGVCLTKENFVGYFYGIDIAPQVLADGMLAARCAFGVHLDMNPGLAGFEFYNVQSASTFKPLGRPLQGDWEYEGTIKELPEFRFRARRMIKSMQHMGFPQYIHRDGRDFFYLTARYVLPGADVPAPDPRAPNEGSWRLKGLPQHGFPYALAIAETRLPTWPAAHVRVARIDPRAIDAAKSGGNAPVVLTVGRTHVAKAAAQQESELGLFLANHIFAISKLNAPPDGATLVARGGNATFGTSMNATAAVGVSDEDGMLQWIELAPGTLPSADTARAMGDLLGQMGCSTRLWLTPGTHAALGGSLDLAAEPLHASDMFASDAILVRANAPGAKPYFPDTPVTGPDVWLNLQNQRVRYFRKPGAPTSDPISPPPPSASGASPAPPAPPSTTAPAPSN